MMPHPIMVREHIRSVTAHATRKPRRSNANRVLFAITLAVGYFVIRATL